jgi:outer membrane receptor protein involved in Fe transport
VRQYQLRSNGTLFSDLKRTKMGFSETEQPINEFGAFAQAENPLKDHLKTNASLRYDKNQNFEGQFTHGLQPLQVLETKTSVCLYQRVSVFQQQHKSVLT